MTVGAPGAPRQVFLGTNRALAAALGSLHGPAFADLTGSRSRDGEFPAAVAGGRVGLWWLAGGLGGARRERGARLDAQGALALAARLPGLDVSGLDLVVPGHLFDRAGDGGALGELIAAARRCAIACRVHVVPHLAGGAGGEWGALIQAVHELREELLHRGARSAEHPLRLLAPPDATVWLETADVTATALLAARGEQAPARAWLHRGLELAVQTLAALLSDAFDLPVALEPDPACLSPADRWLARRVASLGPLLAPPSKSAGMEFWPRAGHRPCSTPEHYRRILRLSVAQRAELDARSRAVAEGATRRREGAAWQTLTGSHLRYAVTGHGEVPFVVVNATGQGLEYWWPMVHLLALGHRVIVWEAADHDLDAHVGELTRIVAAEAPTGCHLVAWCTGAKTALRMARTRPGAVRTITLLAGDLRHDGRDRALDSDYERNLDAVCRALSRSPEHAGRMLQLLSPTDQSTGSAAGSTAESGGITEPRVPYRVLDEAVRHPFSSGARFAAYAKSLVAFWTHDETGEGERIDCPLLFVIGEDDQIVNPVAEAAAAQLFPAARHAVVAGGTHYLMYERAELIADLLREHAADPSRLHELRGDLLWTQLPDGSDNGCLADGRTRLGIALHSDRAHDNMEE